MPRYIRYLEKGEYKYASVKPVGDIDLLKIDAPDLVTAINALIDGGVIDLVQGDIDSINANIGDITNTVNSTSDLVGEIEAQVFDTKAIQDALVAKEIDLRAKLAQTNLELSNTEKDLLNAKAEIDKKVSSLHYEEQYAQLQEALEKKAESANVQSIVESINQDITNQTIEVDNAKNNINNLDTKVNVVKSDLTTTINAVKSDVVSLDTKIATDKQAFDLRISGVEAKAIQDLALVEVEFENSIGEINTTIVSLNSQLASANTDIVDTIASLESTNTILQDAKDELDSVKNNIVYKVEIFSTNGNVFKSGTSNTTLQAKVYHGSQDITNVINASKFLWTRISLDLEGDTAWNMSHAGGTKSVVLTPTDVRSRATFNCAVSE